MDSPITDDDDIILITSENEFESDNNEGEPQINHTPSSQNSQSRDSYTPCHSRNSPRRIESPRRAHSKPHKNNNLNNISINKKSNTTTNPNRTMQSNPSPTAKNGVPNDPKNDKERDYKQKSSRSNSPTSGSVASQNSNSLCQKTNSANLAIPKDVVKKSNGFNDHSSPPSKVPKKQNEEKVEDKNFMSFTSTLPSTEAPNIQHEEIDDDNPSTTSSSSSSTPRSSSPASSTASKSTSSENSASQITKDKSNKPSEDNVIEALDVNKLQRQLETCQSHRNDNKSNEEKAHDLHEENEKLIIENNLLRRLRNEDDDNHRRLLKKAHQDTAYFQGKASGMKTTDSELRTRINNLEETVKRLQNKVKVLESLAPANHEHNPENKNREDDKIPQDHIVEHVPQPKKLQTCHIRFPSSIPGHSKLIQISGNDHKKIETHPESNAHNKKQTAPPNQHQSTQSQNNGHNRGQNQRITPGMDEMNRKHTTFPSNRFQKRIGWYNKRSNKLAKEQRSGVKRPHPSRDFDHDKYTSFMNNNPWKTQKRRKSAWTSLFKTSERTCEGFSCWLPIKATTLARAVSHVSF